MIPDVNGDWPMQINVLTIQPNNILFESNQLTIHQINQSIN